MGDRIAVIALGGNAISRPGGRGDIPQQFENTRKTCEHILRVKKKGYKLCITHGNGPQVGNALRRVELAEREIYPLPLGICVADTEGGMGYMIQQELRNIFIREGYSFKDIATIVTQIVVDKDDPSFREPTKPIGRFYTPKEAGDMQRQKGWVMVEDSGRGWRRVVPSPKPRRIVEAGIIKGCVRDDNIIIACGGGGIPVIEKDNGMLEGVDAVIDKDFASSLLAQEIDADVLVIATAVDRVAINFGRPNQRDFDVLKISEAMKYYENGEFPKGSMGPKVLACCEFVKKTNKTAIITSLENLSIALDGRAGTQIVAD